MKNTKIPFIWQCIFMLTVLSCNDLSFTKDYSVYPPNSLVKELVIDKNSNDFLNLCSTTNSPLDTIPAISSITPSSGMQGDTNLQVNVYGINVNWSISATDSIIVSFTNSGIIVNSIIAVTQTHLLLNIDIAPSAPGGYCNISIQHYKGGLLQSTAIRTNGFGIDLMHPKLISVTPNRVKQGAGIEIAIKGRNTDWIPGVTGITFYFTGSGIAINNIHIIDSVTIRCHLDIAQSAQIGTRSLYLEYDWYQLTLANCFTVEDSLLPTIISINPTSFNQGDTNTISSLYGEDTGWSTSGTDSVRIVFSGSGISTNTVTASSGTILRAGVTLSENAELGLRNITVKQYKNGLLTSEATAINKLTVAAMQPRIDSIIPNNGKQGTIFPVTITGRRGEWTAGTTATLSFSGTGILVSDVQIAGPNTINANIIISASAAVSTRNLSLTYTNPGSSSKTISLASCFSVKDSVLPAIKQISPTSAKQGDTNLVVILIGEDTEWSTSNGDSIKVSFSGTGIIADSVIADTNRQLRFKLSLDEYTALGLRDVMVKQFKNGIVTSSITGVNKFTVNAITPKLSSITPKTGKQGASFLVTITGKGVNWITGPYNSVTVSMGTGITISNPQISSSKTVTADISISPIATTGSRSVNLTYYQQGASSQNLILTSGFSVIDSIYPSIKTISPISARQGDTNVVVTLTGEDTQWSTSGTDSVQVSFSGYGIFTDSVQAVTNKQLRFKLSISDSTGLGLHDVTVKQFVNGILTSAITGANLFTINKIIPKLVSISPITGMQGSAFPVTITGRGCNWSYGPYSSINLSFSVSGITVTNKQIRSSNEVTADLRISETAQSGIRDLTTVYTVSGQPTQSLTLSSCFTVQDSLIPQLLQIIPATAVQGDTNLVIQCTGSDTYWSTMGTDSVQVVISGNGITTHSITVMDSLHLRLKVNIGANTSIGYRNVTVRQFKNGLLTSEVTGTNILKIDSHTPILLSIAPNSGKQATNIPITITGSGVNWASGANSWAVVSLSGTGVSVTNTEIIANDKVEAVVSISPLANIGLRDVSLQFIHPGSPTQNLLLPASFEILDSIMTGIASVTPSLIQQGAANVLVDIYGEGSNWSTTGSDSIKVLFSGSGLTVKSVVAISATHIQFYLSAVTSASLGLRDITIYQLVNGTVNSQLFSSNALSVTPPPPTFLSLIPNNGTYGTNLEVRIKLKNSYMKISPGNHYAEVSFSGAGITCVSTILDSVTISAFLTIASNAALDSSDVSVSYYEFNLLKFSFLVNKAFLVHDPCRAIGLAKNWNLVSVPLVCPDMNALALYPLKNSPVYGYNNNYYQADVLSNGKGYWVKYPQVGTTNICGAVTGTTIIPVKAGWNLIGIYNNAIFIGGITTVPSGIIQTPYYEYNNGYVTAASLKVGKGYWVKSSASGQLNFNMLAKDEPLNLPVYDKEWPQIILSDNAGNSSTLYLKKKISNLSAFELPPPPPEEIFDVRFMSNSHVECMDNGQKEILMNGVDYPVVLHSVGSDFIIRDKATSGKLLNRVLKTNESITVTDERIKVIAVNVQELPKQYALMQNYPNPFNPETKITYSLPEKVFVTLTVYNQLGEKVATLAHQDMDAGTHSISWNAGSINSGIYFYEIKAGTFKSVKKLMLLK